MSTGKSIRTGPGLPVRLSLIAVSKASSNNSALVTLVENLVKCLKDSATGVS